MGFKPDPYRSLGLALGADGAERHQWPKKRQRVAVHDWVTSSQFVAQMEVEAAAKRAKEEEVAARKAAAAEKRVAAAAKNSAIAERKAEREAAGQRPQGRPKKAALPR